MTKKSSPVGSGSGKTRQVYNTSRRGGVNVGSRKKGASPSEIRKQRQKAAIDKANGMANNSGGVLFAQSRQYRNMKVAEWKSFLDKDHCSSTEGAYSNTAATRRGTNLKRGKPGKWLCNIDSQIMFNERRYSNQHNEFRLFIEGAEVTKYVEGSISWTYESTNGMNSLRFVLNNRDDAFLITPENICHGPKVKAGWRVDNTAIRGGRYLPRRYQSTVLDETAKYVIYNNKLRYVHPGGVNEPMIDKNTGMWLFPLNPFSCVIDKHDPVRLFVRLPHVYGVSNPRRRKQTRDLWMAVFTGFVKDYTWDDDPVNGPRYVNVTCYDHRGLLERMRVAVAGIGVATQGQNPGQNSGANKNPSDTKNKDTSSKTDNAVPFNEAFLDLARKVGALYEKTILSEFGQPAPQAAPPNPFKYMQSGSSAAYDHRSAQATQGAQSRAIGLVDKLKELFKELSKLNLFRADCGLKQESGGTVTSMDPDCAKRAWEKTNKAMRVQAATICAGIGEILDASTSLYWIDGTKYQLYIKGVINGIPDLDLRTVGTPDKGNPMFVANAVDAYRKVLKEADDYLSRKDATVAVYSRVNIYSYRGSRAGSKLGMPVDAYNGSSTYVNFSGADAKVNMAEALIWAEVMTMFWWRRLQLAKSKWEPDTKPGTNPSDYNTPEVKNIAAGYRLIADKRNSYRNKLRDIDTRAKSALGVSPVLRNRYKFFDLITGTTVSDTTVGDSGQRELTGGGQSYTGILQTIANGIFAGIRGSVGINVNGDVATHAVVMGLISTQVKTLLGAPAKRLKDSEGILEDINKQKRVILKRMYYYINSTDGVSFPGAGSPRTAPKPPISKKLNVAAIPFPNAFLQIKKQQDNIKNYPDTAWRNFQSSIQGTRANNLFKIQRETINRAQQGSTVRTRAVGDIYSAYVAFDKKSAGLYGDLIEANNGQAHPLMGKSFEAAVEFLCSSNTNILRGRIESIGEYKKGGLDKWNRTVLFGIYQRPLTFKEVTIVGTETVRDTKNYFSPYNAFYHMLRPAEGTGAATIVQKNTSDTSAVARKTAPSFETRKGLLDQICEAIDFQFFCNGMGDLIFEMPNYNAMPHDFGRVFEGAYLIAQDWIKSSVSEESTEVPTGWLVTGNENDKTVDQATNGRVAKGVFRKNSIICTTLAQRIGVRAEHINIKIPGIGAPTSGAALDQMMTYAAFYIQRQLGRAHTFRVSQPFRPYIIPNRPIYLIPRQRIGLPTSVTHTMNPPDGVCTTESNLAYTRWLFRDGTFRFIGGGTRQPVSYTSFYIGVPNYEIKEGTLNVTNSNSVNRGAASKNSAASVARRLRASSVFSAAVNSAGFGLGVDEAASQLPKPPSGKVTQNVDWAGSGFLAKESAETANRAADDKSKKKGAFGAFYNPWKYSEGKGHPWRQWGYFRLFQGNVRSHNSIGTNPKTSSIGTYWYALSGFRQSSRSRDFYHTGIDLLAPRGLKLLTPVDITEASFQFCAGPYYKDKRKLIPIPASEFDRLSSFGNAYAYGSRVSLRKIFQLAAGYPGGTGNNAQEMIPVSKKQWDAFLDITRNGSRLQNMQIIRAGKGGSRLSCLGRVALPTDPNGATVPCVLQYVHLDGPLFVGGKAFGVELRKGSPVARAGNPVCEVGLSMTTDAHLHFNLYIGTDATNKDQKNIVDLTIAANKEFLSKQQLALATGYQFDALDPKTIRQQKILKQPAAKYWQKYKIRAQVFGHTDARKKRVVTVQDAINFMKKRRVWKTATEPGKVSGYKGRWIPTNAFLYFKPHQLLDLSDPKAKSHSALRKFAQFTSSIKAWAAGSSGSGGGRTAGTVYRPMGVQYNPDAVTWCGSANARNKAGNVAKKRKLTAKSKQKTASKPQDKKKNEERTKRNLEKSSAAARAQERAASGDRDKVRKQVNREAARTRNAQNRALRRHPGTATGTPVAPSGN